MPPEANDVRGWNGLGGLDKLLDHRVRLAICVLASRYRQLTFTRLKELLEETDGSLGAHLRKLEDSGYLQVDKERSVPSGHREFPRRLPHSGKLP